MYFFPNLEPVNCSCPVLTVASWPACRSLRRQIRWSGIPISWRIFQFVVIHTVKGFRVVNKTDVDVFLDSFCFFYDPTDGGNLISGSSTFSESSLYIWKFLVHKLLRPNLKDFEHYLASMWDECCCVVVWTFIGIALLWDQNENWLFPVLWALLSFPKYCHIESSTLTASLLRIWNCLAGISRLDRAKEIINAVKDLKSIIM